jgi:signal peptidase
MTMRAVLRATVQVIAWMVILGVSAVLAVTVVVPRIAGATPYTILTGSMQPHYPPGTLVVVKPAPINRIGIGKVITYQLRSGEPTVVTHRVVAVRMTVKGDRMLQTKGDANDSTDPKWVRPVQVKGELWYAVPYLGRATNLLTGRERQAVLLVVVIGLFGYAAVMFGSAFRDRAHKHRGVAG